MDDLDARFECRFCYRLAMTWRAAVEHIVNQQHKDPSVSPPWQLVDEATATKIKTAEETRSFSPHGQLYRCARCNSDEPECWRKYHLSIAHGIWREVEVNDFYSDPDQAVFMPSPVWIEDL